MRLSGFTYIRNGIELDYPFLESIRSVLPICDEFVVAVGDSHDGTREAIEALASPKIKIIDTVWDMSLREGGKLFAQQSNLALDGVTGDWCLHIQADEVIHEKDVHKIREEIERYDADPRVEGFILPYIHFWGSYHYYRSSRKIHRFEVRVFRNLPGIRSFKDSQGFRKYSNEAAYLAGEKGEKIRVKKIDAPVFHYSYVRPPKQMEEKNRFFHRFWHDDQWIEDNADNQAAFDYEKIDRLSVFEDSHPAVMQARIENQDWQFEWDASQSSMSLKDKVIHAVEGFFGVRIGEYKNYKLI